MKTPELTTHHRMLRDVELFKSRISKLDGAADLGDYLVNLVNNKTVAQREESSAEVPESIEVTESTEASERKSQDNTTSAKKS